MEYQIIATLGPASADPDTILALQAAGATGFRLNTSHLSVEEVELWLERLRLAFRGRGTVPPVVLDLQGGKWRLGRFEERELVPGEPVVLAAHNAPAGGLPVPHPEFFARVGSGDLVLLNDGRVSLRVTAVGSGRVDGVVERGGRISSRKSVTLPGRGGGAGPRGELSARDRRFLETGERYSFLRYAISYLESAGELALYGKHFPDPRALIAKLERGAALAEAREIAALCGEVWLCRGDLGAELGPRDMALAAGRFAELLPALPAPALLAGQVLEHLVGHPQATRSELCHLLEILEKGYAGIVLSDETAIGRYPVESCRTAALFR